MKSSRRVRRLRAAYGTERRAFDAIGYRELIDHLEGKLSLEESVALMKANTWQYARRQMTWFRRDKDIRWIANEKEAQTLVKKFLGKRGRRK